MTSIGNHGDQEQPSKAKIYDTNQSVPWFIPNLENIDAAPRDLLENYSRIPPDKVIPHILAIRDRAWEMRAYPCLGEFQFLDLALSRSPSYPSILERVIGGASILDIGCCFGQDLRKLVHDGAPPTNLYGVDLLLEFMSLSYELFNDKDTFGAQFMEADIFEEGGAIEAWFGKMDIINAGLFLHLWDLSMQMKACERMVRLLKPEEGALIIGEQVGATDPAQPTLMKSFKHNVETFEKMWREVGERTGTKWKVTASLDMGMGMEQKKWLGPYVRRLAFEVERIL